MKHVSRFFIGLFVLAFFGLGMSIGVALLNLSRDNPVFCVQMLVVILIGIAAYTIGKYLE